MLYGIFARLVFGLSTTQAWFHIMSFTFILGVPVSLGFIVVWFADPRRQRYSWLMKLFLPWSAAVIFLVACLVIAWEGLICVVLWLPLALVLSSVGAGLAMILQLLLPTDRSKNLCVAIVACAPFFSAPIESLHASPRQLRTVRTDIVIDASAEKVWEQIRSVPRIQPREQSWSMSHALGFPLPVEATIEGQGVGAVRHARFEGGVLFIETITEWQAPRKLAFSIVADTARIPPTTFDEHVTIGGDYFDVLRGAYEIEPLGPERVRLHLSSVQRLSTGFNFYAGLWTEWLMGDLQRYILRIIRSRCEGRG
ncbi:MAG: SRPBCC family protein [Verrucomicrobia bacterium]|nr:SRPBCC family protein [Verrucomicrobiota bacterium]MBI3868021.1 SRPBCC family protein [Verrucomicrobiota bacterium]